MSTEENPEKSVDTPQLPKIALKKDEERRLRAGHLWVFSNEIDVEQTPLTAFAPGDPVLVVDQRGKSVGTGYVNPHSLIAVRLLSRDPEHPIGRSLLVHRIKVALSLREMLFDKPFYRLAHGEGDGLPGLVVDRYGDIVVAQLNSAGMDRMSEDIVAALDKVLNPSAILLRNDNPIRELEGLKLESRVAKGSLPERLRVEEGGAQFEVSAQGGQKTGWFFDQRRNRERLRSYVAGKRVLDLFSYVGSFGVNAALAGAESVTCVDSSESALQLAGDNAERNGVEERMQGLLGDAFEILKALREDRERFDVIVVDPPAFIKRKKDMKSGLEGYRHLNQAAMQLLSRDAILFSCSCSQHLERLELQRILLRSARHLDRNMQLLEHGHQAPDHPIHPAIPESEYLKALVARVTPS